MTSGGESGMRDERFITKSEQYALIYDKGSTWVDNLLVMKSMPNGLPLARYGFSISKRVGKAVIRNRIRRRLREILRLSPLQPGWDAVFIARPEASMTDCTTLSKSVVSLLSRARLLAKENEEVKLRDN